MSDLVMVMTLEPLTLLTLVVLVQLETLERCSSGDELVRELALALRVIVAAILLVHLLVSLL
jgi:hypothetical protein